MDFDDALAMISIAPLTLNGISITADISSDELGYCLAAIIIALLLFNVYRRTYQDKMNAHGYNDDDVNTHKKKPKKRKKSNKKSNRKS